jgi:uncharacterized protein with GYD domain
MATRASALAGSSIIPPSWRCKRCSVPAHPSKESIMFTYIGLMRFTDKGVQTVKDTTARAAAAKELAKKNGVNMREIFWTMGKYDLVCVIEAEDEQALAAFNLAVAMQGNVRTQSMRAYPSNEMNQILAKLS